MDNELVIIPAGDNHENKPNEPVKVSIAHDSRDHCVFFEQSKCNFHMLVSTLGFFTSVFFLVVDWRFVAISSAQKRKLVTQCELVINSTIAFFTFVAFWSVFLIFYYIFMVY